MQGNGMWDPFTHDPSKAILLNLHYDDNQDISVLVFMYFEHV